MVSLRLFKRDDDGAPEGARTERRSGHDRRSGRDRRAERPPRRHERRRRTRDLYKNDLDRHLWSWTSAAAERRRKVRKRRTRRRTVAGIVVSTVGAIGAAGLSFLLLRKLRDEELPPDPEEAEADLNEADFED
jgi:hypothetical protein